MLLDAVGDFLAGGKAHRLLEKSYLISIQEICNKEAEIEYNLLSQKIDRNRGGI